MKRLIPAITLVLVTGCGSEATLYVEDAGQLVANARDTIEGAHDTGREPDDTTGGGDTTVRDTGTPDTGTTDTGTVPDTGSPDTGLAPACAEIPTSLDFGLRTVGLENVEPLWISSCGDLDADNLVVTSVTFVNEGGITSAPEFFFAGSTGTPITIVPFDRARIDVHYRSEVSGAHSAVIRVQTNDPSHATVDVAVTGSVP